MGWISPFLAAAVLILPASGLAEQSTLDAGWKEAAGFLFREAEAAFRAPDAHGQERERKLGEGITLLNAQPRSQAKIRRAIALFGEVAAQKEDDDFGLIARLSEARAAENHLSPRDKPLARKLYRELAAAKPGHPICELAAARLVILDLYEEIDAETLNRRARELAGLGEALQTKEGRANFHYTLGMALVELQGDPKMAADQLKEALELGLADWQNEARALVGLGASAESAGEWDVAEGAYSRFVEAFKRDRRTYAIRERLKAVRAHREGNPK